MIDIKPLVSVVIPTYNGAKRIVRTLESVVSQDYENIEIIVVDDVSTDNTEKASRQFYIVRRAQNGRQSAARNTGLDVSKGKYVVFIDHDDLIEKNFVSLLCNTIETSQVDLAFCGYTRFYENENRYENEERLFKCKISSPHDYLKAWADDEVPFFSVWNFIFPKSFLSRNHLRFNEKCYICEDIEFIHKAVALSSNIRFVDKILYTYMIYPGQQSKTDVTNRTNYKVFNQDVLASFRASRCILRNTNDKYIRDYVKSYCIAKKILRYCTLTACAKDYRHYIHIIRTLNHKAIRSIMLLTVKFIFREPELFLKCLMLVYFPNFYYTMRSRHEH